MITVDLENPDLKSYDLQNSGKGGYTYGVHENCQIFKTPSPLVQLRPKFFHLLDL